MSIGLFDADFFKYAPMSFNLELMKLAFYYKNKREIVVLSPLFNPPAYQRFFYRKDYDDSDFPKDINKYNNLQYGGIAFSHNKYIPLPELYEKQVPDTTIYNRFEGIFNPKGYKYLKNAFKILNNSVHMRLSLDGKNIWEDFSKQIRLKGAESTLFLHDLNINEIKDAKVVVGDLLKYISKNKVRQNLALKFPLKINCLKEIEDWMNIKTSKDFFGVQIDKILQDEELNEMFMNYNMRPLFRKVEYTVTKSSMSEQDFVQNVLPILYRQVVFLHTHRIKVSLKYERDFFEDKRWEKLIDLFSFYLSSLSKTIKVEKSEIIKDKETLYNFVSTLSLYKPRYYKGRGYITKPEAREIFQFVAEKNYEVFKEFYECKKVRLQGGIFVND